MVTSVKMMQPVATKLEARVTILERQLQRMKSELKAVRKTSQRPWWERVSGRFKNDPLFDEIARAGKAYRRSLNTRSR
jgi:hypothetical protein